MHKRVPLTAASTAAAFLAPLAPSAPTHIVNDLLPHQYVATLSPNAELAGVRSSGLALFRATLDQRPRVRQANRPFKPGDPFVWRVAYTRLSSPVSSIRLRAAVPGRTGQTLVTLCSPCAAGAHGKLPLNGPLAIALDQSPLCQVQSPCSIAEPAQFAVYVEIATVHYPRGEIRGQLRFCSTAPTFHDRGSCSPLDYPALTVKRTVRR